MPFFCALSSQLGATPCPRPHVVLDTSQGFEPLVMEACELLAEEQGYQFLVTGFGSSPWPVDVAYDLSTFLEQVPSLARGMRESRPVEVDFYGQGLERTLAFSRQGDDVQVRCASRTAWQPDPELEVVNFVDFMVMIGSLVTEFAKGLERAGVDITVTPPFDRWCHGQV